MLYWIWCRESKADRDHSRSRGLPAVLPNPRTFSRTFEYTYERLHPKLLLGVAGDSPNLSCLLSDFKSERSSVTRENSWLTRASREAIAPLAGTMLVVCTKTGR